MGHIDFAALSAAIDVQRSTQGLSVRDVAQATGLSASTFTRLRQGHGIEADGYVVCCRWLGVSLATFVTGQPAARPANLAGELSTLLHRYGVPVAYWTILSNLIYQLANPGYQLVEATPNDKSHS